MTVDLSVKEEKTKKAQGDIVVLFNFFHKDERSTVYIKDFVVEVKELTKPVLRQLADGIRDESYDY